MHCSLLSFNTRKHTSTASCAILSNFFEEQRPQNHPQYLSGLSRALFPTTFLEIAVNGASEHTVQLPNCMNCFTVITWIAVPHQHLQPDYERLEQYREPTVMRERVTSSCYLGVESETFFAWKSNSNEVNSTNNLKHDVKMIWDDKKHDVYGWTAFFFFAQRTFIQFMFSFGLMINSEKLSFFFF